jgi:serine/threonine protein kinase
MYFIISGHIGKVFKADYNHSDKSKSIEVAVKTLFASNEHTNKAILQEFELMASMVHPNIVKLYGIVTEDGYSGSPWIVLEYFPNGDLKTYLNVR